MHDSTHLTRLPRTRHTRRIAAAALVSGILIAGCGGSANSPGVASVNSTTSTTSTTSSTTSSGAGTGTTTTSPSSTATTPKDPAQLLVEWARCMRSHGDPNQADPAVTVNKLISIPWNPAIPGGYYGTNKGGRATPGPASTAGSTWPRPKPHCGAAGRRSRRTRPRW
jgi:hypothetical protein